MILELNHLEELWLQYENQLLNGYNINEQLIRLDSLDQFPSLNG
jgi:hypothetical protein